MRFAYPFGIVSLVGTTNAKSNRDYRSADMDMFEVGAYEYSVPEGAIDGFDYADDLGHGRYLNVRYAYLENPWRCVDFAFNHYAASDNEYNRTGTSSDVARIDCKENSIHRHQFFRSGRDQEKHIYNDFSEQSCEEDCIEIISSMYDKCYIEMMENSEHHFREWRDR